MQTATKSSRNTKNKKKINDKYKIIFIDFPPKCNAHTHVTKQNKMYERMNEKKLYKWFCFSTFQASKKNAANQKSILIVTNFSVPGAKTMVTQTMPKPTRKKVRVSNIHCEMHQT